MGLISNLSFAETSPQVVEQSSNNRNFETIMYKYSHILRTANANIISSSESLPHNTQEAHELFEDRCATRGDINEVSKKVSLTYNYAITNAEFECVKKDYFGAPQSTKFIISIKNEKLVDLKIINLQAQTDRLDFNQYNLESKDKAEMAIAVGLSVLASGLTAKELYNNEPDKVLHAEVGSIISATATLFSYYGLHLNKTQSLLVGIATTIVISLAKEYLYDSQFPGKHSVDVNDAIATMYGGGVSALFIKIKFEF